MGMGRFGSAAGAIRDGDFGAAIFLGEDDDEPDIDFDDDWRDGPLIETRLAAGSSCWGDAGLFPPIFPPNIGLLLEVGSDGRFVATDLPFILSENSFLCVIKSYKEDESQAEQSQ
jgi:hypothetical protein